MKITMKILAVILLITVAVIALQAEQSWYLVSGRVTALDEVIVPKGDFGMVMFRAHSARFAREARLDAALMEFKLCNPERFAQVFGKYALEFNTEGLAVDPEAIVSCGE